MTTVIWSSVEVKKSMGPWDQLQIFPIVHVITDNLEAVRILTIDETKEFAEYVLPRDLGLPKVNHT